MTITIEGLTKDRMLAIEAASVVGGVVDGAGHLILTKHDGSDFDAGYVVGPQGPPYLNGVDTVSAQNVGGQKQFTSDLRATPEVVARYNSVNEVKIGIVGGGIGAGIQFVGAQHSIAIISANRMAFTLNNVEMIDLQPAIISLLQPVAAATVTNKFGRGVTGAANAFVQIGDDTFGGLIQAGHGTVADTDLRIQAKGIGNVVFLSPVLSVAAINSLGRGSQGGANAFVKVGDDSAGAFVVAGHGTVANIDLRLAGKGTGAVQIDSPIFGLSGSNSFGRGSRGANSAYVIIGDDASGAAIVAGHGVVANMDLQLYPKGTGAVLIRTSGGAIVSMFQNDATVKMIGSHHLFGPGANGAAGQRLHHSYDSVFCFLTAENQAGDPTAGNLHIDGGSVYIQLKNTAGEIRTYNTAGVYIGGVDINGSNHWVGQWHAFGGGAAGGSGRYIQIGEDGSGAAVVSAQGTAADIHTAIRSKGTGSIFFQKGDGSTTWAQLSNAAADLDTWLLIRRSVGGVERIDRVVVGGVDSGGAGFRVLRIAN